LEELVAKLGVGSHVQFLGEVKDAELLRCYQQCDVFALANRAVGKDVEGFGMVLLEAQACGRPVLTGNSGGTAETTRPNESGLVVPCDRPDEPAAALAELLGDPAKLDRMGRAGRAWVAAKFDWPILAAEAKGVFDSLH
jgi:phosphatidylinositol alpha-1,6-mannosyltransferase